MVRWCGSLLARCHRNRRDLTTDYTDYTERVFSHKEQEDMENHILAQRVFRQDLQDYQDCEANSPSKIEGVAARPEEYDLAV